MDDFDSQANNENNEKTGLKTEKERRDHVAATSRLIAFGAIRNIMGSSFVGPGNAIGWR